MSAHKPIILAKRVSTRSRIMCLVYRELKQQNLASYLRQPANIPRREYRFKINST